MPSCARAAEQCLVLCVLLFQRLPEGNELFHEDAHKLRRVVSMMTGETDGIVQQVTCLPQLHVNGAYNNLHNIILSSASKYVAVYFFLLLLFFCSLFYDAFSVTRLYRVNDR
jgi:hypothetical protein